MIFRLVYHILEEYRLYIYDLYSDNELNNDMEQQPWIHYKQTRNLLIKIFRKEISFSLIWENVFVYLIVKIKEFPKSKQLAEEFEDYQVLIEICDELKDTEQLRTYIEQYGDKVMKRMFVFSRKIIMEKYFS